MFSSFTKIIKYRFNATLFPGFFANRAFYWRDVTLLDIETVFQIWSTQAGYKELPGNLSQSKPEKYFE